jgi:hypothetical protein
MSKTFSITSRAFYKSTSQCYIKVLVLDRMPDRMSPINQIVKRTVFDKLSPFKCNSPCSRDETCGIVILKPTSLQEYATIEDIPEVFNWLIQNRYTIDTAITQMLNQGEIRLSNPIVCFITEQN